MVARPYLMFNGDCEEAFASYTKIFGGEITFAQKFEDSPMGAQMPEMRGKMMHITLTAGDLLLQGSDSPHYLKPQGLSVTIELSGAEEAERIFCALAEGGSVSMPVQKTFWAERFGMCTDRFGIPWMINAQS